ncbi:MAG: flagellar hook-associated protein FlgL [Actinomycetes bacterium]
MNTAVSRVTQRSNGQQAIIGLQASQRRLAVLQAKMSSGKAITKPSDDPNATFSALQFRGEQARFTQWSRNAGDGLSLLKVADGQLQSMTQQVQRAKVLMIQGANTITMTSVEREAIATEIDSLREGLMMSANFTYLGRPIFGGTTTGDGAFDSTTGAYVGDTIPVSRTAGPASTVRVDTNGAEAFTTTGTPSGTTIFEVLTSAAAHLRNNPSGLAADSAHLDSVLGSLSTAQAQIGSATNRLENLKSVADAHTLTLAQSISGVEDTDLTKTILDLTTQQTSYQAALQATAKIVQPSLMDFLR